MSRIDCSLNLSTFYMTQSRNLSFCDVRFQARPRFRILQILVSCYLWNGRGLSSVPFRSFWTSFSFYIHPWPLDGSKMVRYDWSLPVQSGGCRFDPYDFEACVVFSKRFEFKNFTCKNASC